MTVLLGVVSAFLSYRLIFLGTSGLLVLANFVYILAGVSGSKWVIFVARILLGLGAGTLSIVRAYFIENFDVSDRTAVLAVVAAVQYGGFALFPGVGDLMELVFTSSSYGSSSDDQSPYLPPNITKTPSYNDSAPWSSLKPVPVQGKLIDEYTAPAWLMLCFSALSIILLFVSFKNPEQPKHEFHLRDLVPFYKPQVRKMTGGLFGHSIRKAFGLPIPEPHPSDSPQFSFTKYSSDEQHGSSQSSDTSSSSSNHRFTPFEASNDLSPTRLSTKGKSDSHSNFQEEELPELPSSVAKTGYSSDENWIDQTTFDDHNDTEMINIDDSASKRPSIEVEDGRYSVEFGSRDSIDSTISNPDPPTRRQRHLVTIIWLSFLVINFLIRVVLGTIETLGATLYEAVTKKLIEPPAEAFSPTSGTFYTILGVVGVVVVIALALVAKKVPDHLTFIASLLSLLLGSLLLIGNLETMTLARFIFGSGFMYSVGYPLAQSVVVSMFSKIPASARSQSASMSWIGSVGSIGRIVGPLIAGAIYQHSGSTNTWIFNSSIAAVLLVQAAVTLHFMWKIEE
jgi:MFS family permease